MSLITSRATLDILGKYFPKVMALSIHCIQIFQYFSIRKCKCRDESKSFLENKTEKCGEKSFWHRRKSKKEEKREHYIHLPDIRLPKAHLWTMQEQRKKKIARVIWHKAVCLKPAMCVSPPDYQTFHCFMCLLRRCPMCQKSTLKNFQWPRGQRSLIING